MPDPTVADSAPVTVFQRSAPWMFPNPHYHDPVGSGVTWAIRHLPFYGRWYRFLLWLGALTRDDVDLVTDAIAEVVPEGIVDATGRLHPVDVIVWATGFHANRYLWPMEIVGRDGWTSPPRPTTRTTSSSRLSSTR